MSVSDVSLATLPEISLVGDTVLETDPISGATVLRFEVTLSQAARATSAWTS